MNEQTHNHHHFDTDCSGCNKQDKPSNCKDNACGRCCQAKGGLQFDAHEQELLLTLLERTFLPFVYIETASKRMIIVKEDAQIDVAQIYCNEQIIQKFESMGFVTIDFDIELDVYSYSDYDDFDSSQFVGDEAHVVKRGSIATTKQCFDRFLKKDA